MVKYNGDIGYNVVEFISEERTGLGPCRLCQYNFKHNRLSILVRIMME